MKFSIITTSIVTIFVLALGISSAANASDSKPEILKALTSEKYNTIKNDELRGSVYHTNSNPYFYADRIKETVCGPSWRKSVCTGNGWFSTTPYSTANVGGYTYTYEVRVARIRNGWFWFGTEWKNY